jgi:hypothetical protein
MFSRGGMAAARSYAARLAILHEELDAWERGRALGRRLLKLSNRSTYLTAFEKERPGSVMSYVRWASI